MDISENNEKKNGASNIDYCIFRTVDRLWSITEDLNILYKENWTRLAAQEVQQFQVSDVINLPSIYLYLYILRLFSLTAVYLCKEFLLFHQVLLFMPAL